MLRLNEMEIVLFSIFTAYFIAIFFFSFLLTEAVTTINTGIVPIGSITVKNVIKAVSSSFIVVFFYTNVFSLP